jgi:hypothetical protein
LDRARLPEAVREAAASLHGPSLAAALQVLEAETPRLRSARSVQAIHDALLFALAHPPDAAAHRAATLALQALCDRVAAAPRLADALRNTGIAGTRIEISFSLPVVRWLAARFPGQVAYDTADADFELTQLVVREVLLPPERERLERESRTLDRWLASTERDRARRLGRLLDWLASLSADEHTQELLFAALRVFVCWTLDGAAPSLSAGRSLPRETFYSTERIRDVPLTDWVRKPLPAPARLTLEERDELLATARGVLACLMRETDPLTYGSAAGVTLFRLERGVDVALFEMRPGYRLALESYIGYMAFRNGVPAAYGGTWLFGHRCKIGINIFPFMRGGESALLLAQLMRVYAQHYGPQVFLVEPYQIGQGNADGIRTGAFWFYYRLGFRPVQPALAALAETEFARVREGARTSPAVLRRLADADLRWAIPGARTGALPDPYAVNRALSAHVERAFGGDRRAAVAASGRIVRRLFKGIAARGPLESIRAAYGPLLDLLPDLAGWPEARRRRFAAMLLEKLRGDELGYARSLARNEPYLRALASLCRGDR